MYGSQQLTRGATFQAVDNGGDRNCHFLGFAHISKFFDIRLGKLESNWFCWQMHILNSGKVQDPSFKIFQSCFTWHNFQLFKMAMVQKTKKLDS